MTDPLLVQYLLESRECLEEADKSLLALEREPGAGPLLDALFRALHTVKGGAGLFDLAPVVTLTHAAESALGQVRKQAQQLSPELISVLFQVLDSLKQWLDAIENGQTLDAQVKEQAKTLIQDLAAFNPDAVLPSPSPQATADTSWVAQLPSSAWLKPDVSSAAPRTAVTYTPDEGCFFSGDDPLKIMRGLPGLLALQLSYQKPLPPLDALESYQCYLKFFAISDAPAEELQAYCRPLAEQVVLSPLATTPTKPQALQPLFRQVIDAQLQILQLPQTAATPARVSGVIDILKNAVGYMQDAPTLAALALAAQAATEQADLAPLKNLLKSLLNYSPNAGETPGKNRVREPMLETPGEDAGLIISSNAEAANSSDRRQARRWIKVEQAKIDELLDLLSELTVAHNGLLHKLDGENAATLLHQVRERHGRMQRTVQTLQEIGMGIRMLPLSQVLQRLPRLTRDLAQRMDKKVRLAIEGEDTEADKKVVENLAEPLLHIVRNSIGHGIESVPERLAAGKQAEGLIRLRAFQRGEQAVIEVQDDGRGIDAEAVKKKAIAHKLVKKSTADKLSSDDLLQLVFLPGFSTATEVSEVAGRGVGMDVVKSVIESVGGRVAIASELGQGTTVTLSLPLDISLTKVMAVKVGDQLFGIPMPQVRQTLRVPRSAIRRIKKKYALALGEQVIPLVFLQDILSVASSEQTAAEVCILVLDSTQGPLAVIVDGFAEPIDVVVKPMAGILRGLTHYAGNALLPDGAILLILDIRSVVHHAA